MPIDYSKRPKAGPSPAAPPGATPAPGTAGGRVSLTKSSPSVSLAKTGGGGGRLRVNLNWNARPVARGGMFKRSTSIDLDLGCMWELTDGRKGVVQALGDSFGSFDAPPYVVLDKDDRSGASLDGENLFVNLAHAADIRRILVYAFIYEGVAAFEQADGVVTLFPQSGPPIEVRLDEQAGKALMCAVALIDNSSGQLVVSRQVRYFRGHQDLDEGFGWGMRWVAGRK